MLSAVPGIRGALLKKRHHRNTTKIWPGEKTEHMQDHVSTAIGSGIALFSLTFLFLFPFRVLLGLMEIQASPALLEPK